MMTIKYDQISEAIRPLKLTEVVADPTAAIGDGYLYTKAASGQTELFYMDELAQVIQLSRDGYLNTPFGVFPEEATDPEALANTGFVYTKDDGGDTELYYRDDSGNVVQITQDGVVNASGAGNTLNAAYDQGGAGVGRTITADSGPVYINASGDNALHLDGYLKLDEISDPSALGQAGFVYTKDDSGDTELFYMDDSGNAVQLTLDGAVNAAASGNTLNAAYDQGGAGVGRTITADSGPVYIDASGDNALHLDGYLKLDEISDPSAFGQAGMLYTKDVSGATELFYLDDSGNVVQLTDGGTTANGAAYDDSLSSSGSETEIVLTASAKAASNKASSYDVDVYRNGVLMKYVGSLGSDKMEWTYTSGTKTVSFVASGTSDWYRVVYRA